MHEARGKNPDSKRLAVRRWPTINVRIFIIKALNNIIILLYTLYHKCNTFYYKIIFYWFVC